MPGKDNVTIIGAVQKYRIYKRRERREYRDFVLCHGHDYRRYEGHRKEFTFFT